MVKIKSKSKTHLLRALLDSGSQHSFITDSAAATMGLSKRSATLNLTEIGNKRSSLKTGIVQFRAESQFSSDSVNVTAFSLPQLSDVLPPVSITASSTQP